jgi:hypothetical protein
MLALLEIILAAIALAPRVASNLKANASVVQTSAQVQQISVQPTADATAIPSTPFQEQAPLPSNSQKPAAFLPSQYKPDSSPLNQLLGDRQGERPLRQPPADTALNGKAALQIVNATLNNADDGSKKLQVAIKANPSEQVDSSQEKVQVYFYDQDGEEIVPSKAQVTSKWLNWKSGEPQLVEVTYLPETVDPGIKFAGYVIAIYYKGDLQDCRAQPGRLQKLFEPKYYIGSDE